MTSDPPISASRSPRPENSGSSQIFCATPVLNGLSGPAEYPQYTPISTMATPTTLSKPIASDVITKMATKGNVSSAMPKVAPPMLKAAITMAISTYSRPLKRLIKRPSPALMAPLFWMMAKAPPTTKTKAIRSDAFISPSKTEENSFPTETGFCSTY